MSTYISQSAYNISNAITLLTMDEVEKDNLLREQIHKISDENFAFRHINGSTRMASLGDYSDCHKSKVDS